LASGTPAFHPAGVTIRCCNGAIPTSLEAHMKDEITVTTRQAVNDFALACMGALAVGAAAAAAEIAFVALIASAAG
jgi:hypothetical protein